jgi:ferredoxin
MRLSVDAHLCSGQGRCYVVSSEIFDSDDDGFCLQRGSEVDVPAGLEDKGRLAVESCPEGAIAVVSESEPASA